MRRVESLTGQLTPNLITRSLEQTDFSKGYLQLLSQLTIVGEINKSQFEARFAELGPEYHIAVIEDVGAGKVVAAATLLIEKKFIHDCGVVGHIEDVVVNSDYRGQRLGQKVIEELVREGKVRGCYKIILDCSEDNAGFYNKLGFKVKELQMVQYLE